MQTSNQAHLKVPRKDDSEISELLFLWRYVGLCLAACLTFHSSFPAARELYWHLQELHLNFIRAFTTKQLF